MNRRAFLKSTAISLISPTLLLKGEELLKPLKWTSFAYNSPKNKELVLIAQKCNNVVFYVIGTMEKNNTVSVKNTEILSFNNKKIGKRTHLPLKKIDVKQSYQNPYLYYQNPYVLHDIYKINENTCFWIKIIDILNNMNNIPFNKTNINIDIVEIKRSQNCYGMYVGKIKNINKQRIKLIRKISYFDTELFQTNNNSVIDWKNVPYNYNKNDIIGWTQLPKL